MLQPEDGAGAGQRDDEALVISHKTVARHLSNIFVKCGLSTRAAATAYAFDHHLLTSPRG
jgi:ATP/maltotriose-dependent transcriptional regulator MalT